MEVVLFSTGLFNIDIECKQYEKPNFGKLKLYLF